MDKKIIYDLSDRRRWFDAQWPLLEKKFSCFKVFTYLFPLEVKFLRTCPCCGYPTLEKRLWYDICQICWWEDDGQDDADADEITGGPNYDLSLTKARENFVNNKISFNIDDERFNKIGEKTYAYRQQIISTFEDLQKVRNQRNRKETKKKFKMVKKLLKNATNQL